MNETYLIDAALELAFTAASDLGSSVISIPPIEISGITDGTVQTVSTEIYDGPDGSGFQVVGIIKFPNGVSAKRVIQSGPESFRSVDWPSTDLSAYSNSIFEKVKSSKQNSIYNSASNVLSSIFNTLSIGDQVNLSSVKQAVLSQAELGNYLLAQSIISTVSVPSNLVSVQSELVSAIDPYISIGNQLSSATTIDQISYIQVP